MKTPLEWMLDCIAIAVCDVVCFLLYPFVVMQRWLKDKLDE